MSRAHLPGITFKRMFNYVVGAWAFDLAVLPFTDTVSEHDGLVRTVESTVSTCIQRLSRHGVRAHLPGIATRVEMLAPMGNHRRHDRHGRWTPTDLGLSDDFDLPPPGTCLIVSTDRLCMLLLDFMHHCNAACCPLSCPVA
jgi:hypothetical protein